MTQDNPISKDPKSDADQVSKKQNNESLIKKAIVGCLVFTYCAFVGSFFLSNISVTHKFEKNGTPISFEIQHSGKSYSPIGIKHSGTTDINHSGRIYH